jgi:hypothetical protein
MSAPCESSFKGDRLVRNVDRCGIGKDCFVKQLPTKNDADIGLNSAAILQDCAAKIEGFGQLRKRRAKGFGFGWDFGLTRCVTG